MDAHEREYQGAVNAMAETYGSCTLPSVGDRIAWRLPGWPEASSEAGRVVRVVPGLPGLRPLLVVEPEGDETQRVIDARPWPIGAVLPF